MKIPKMLLGKRGADTGLWISKPGESAADPTDGMLIDSGDIYFQLHCKIVATVTYGAPEGSPHDYRYSSPATYMYPTALSFKPVVFAFTASEDQMRYPPYAGETLGPTDAVGFMHWVAYPNRIVLLRSCGFLPSLVVNFWVFKIPLEIP